MPRGRRARAASKNGVPDLSPLDAAPRSSAAAAAAAPELDLSLFVDDCYDVVNLIQRQLDLRAGAAKRTSKNDDNMVVRQPRAVPPRPKESARVLHRQQSARIVPPRPRWKEATKWAIAVAKATKSDVATNPVHDPPLDAKWRRSSPHHARTLQGARHLMQTSPVTGGHRARHSLWGVAQAARAAAAASGVDADDVGVDAGIDAGVDAGVDAGADADLALLASTPPLVASPGALSVPTLDESKTAVAFRSGAPNRPPTQVAAKYDAWKNWDAKAVFPWPAAWASDEARRETRTKHADLAEKVLAEVRKVRDRARTCTCYPNPRPQSVHSMWLPLTCVDMCVCVCCLLSHRVCSLPPSLPPSRVDAFVPTPLLPRLALLSPFCPPHNCASAAGTTHRSAAAARPSPLVCALKSITGRASLNAATLAVAAVVAAAPSSTAPARARRPSPRARLHSKDNIR